MFDLVKRFVGSGDCPSISEEEALWKIFTLVSSFGEVEHVITLVEEYPAVSNHRCTRRVHFYRNPVVYAAAHGNYDVVVYILNCWPAPITERNMSAALSAAGHHLHLDVVRLLLVCGATTRTFHDLATIAYGSDKFDRDHSHPKRFPIIRMAIEAGDNPGPFKAENAIYQSDPCRIYKGSPEDYSCLLSKAASIDDPQAVELALELGADVNSPVSATHGNGCRMSILEYCVLSNCWNVARLLVGRGATVTTWCLRVSPLPEQMCMDMILTGVVLPEIFINRGVYRPRVANALAKVVKADMAELFIGLADLNLPVLLLLFVYKYAGREDYTEVRTPLTVKWEVGKLVHARARDTNSQIEGNHEYTE